MIPVEGGMLWSFGALARLARAAVPATLVPPGAWPPMDALREAWPARATGIGGVECRLGALAGGPDLAFCVSAARGGRDALASRTPADAAAGVFRFLGRWADPGSPLHRYVPLIWLEFDHGPLLSPRPAPFVTFRVAWARGSKGPAAAPLVALIEEGIAALTGRLPEACRDGLLHCLGALPGTGSLGHVAALPHRQSDTIRLVLALRACEVAPYLRRVGWRGQPGDVGATLAGIWPDDEAVGVNLDVGGGVGPRVGVELHRPTSPRDDPRWSALLSRLVAAGACTDAQRQGLEEWPSGACADRPERRPSLVRQLLVKVVFEPRRPLQAKAYLAFTPRWRLFESPAHTSRPIALGS